ncbi:DUF1707 and DUF4190 domain-containing protein [Streptomyces sp. H10-C2]|nr:MULTISPECIES: DUF1707 and DUF4190 domain-containing protein [unclassified Streptomyces]MDJ0340667.1 DUF1707 and DUF4190 domain-containing protein [Streptomyces sp. PH10-H1]MDJ0370315.1 DUF1707 and DUF4190 domain-containing protein [Streptomyces sp. H10-C2]
MLAADADRERTVDVLKAAFAEGRLKTQEYEQRMSTAYQARTYGELQMLVHDLPQGPSPMPAQLSPLMGYVPRTFLPAPPRTNSLAVASLICGLGGFTVIAAVPAVILGHKARNEIRRTGENGDGFAVAGLVMGWLVIGFVALMFLLSAVGA